MALASLFLQSFIGGLIFTSINGFVSNVPCFITEKSLANARSRFFLKSSHFLYPPNPANDTLLEEGEERNTREQMSLHHTSWTERSSTLTSELETFVGLTFSKVSGTSKSNAVTSAISGTAAGRESSNDDNKLAIRAEKSPGFWQAIRADWDSLDWGPMLRTATDASCISVSLVYSLASLLAFDVRPMRGWTVAEMAARIPYDSLHLYALTAKGYPSTTAIATSASAFFLGEVAAQSLSEKRRVGDYDRLRGLKWATAGALVHAPINMLYVPFADAVVQEICGDLTGNGRLLVQTLVDNSLYFPVVNFAFFFYIALLSGSKSEMKTALKNFKELQIPLATRVWRFIPCPHPLLRVIWITILCGLDNQYLTQCVVAENKAGSEVSNGAKNKLQNGTSSGAAASSENGTDDILPVEEKRPPTNPLVKQVLLDPGIVPKGIVESPQTFPYFMGYFWVSWLLCIDIFLHRDIHPI